jgi:TatD DNase family protein
MADVEIEAELQLLEKLLPEAQACGETGVDAFKTQDKAAIRKQREVFERHLQVNSGLNLPLVLHIVIAHEASLDILRRHSYRGIVHGFSGSWVTAKNYISLGYKISIGRGIYQKGFKHLKETAAKIDLGDFVIESDAFVSDEGGAEDPIAILLKVAECLAEIKSVPLEKIGRANSENVKSIFV